MVDRRLRPWQRLPTVTCERCDRQATWRVAAGTATVEPGAVLLGSDPMTASVLTCDGCEQDVADEICDRYGGSGGEPLRMSWRTWFLTRTWIGRPFSALEIAWSNWRFERAATRYWQCSHDLADWPAGQRCPNCGFTRI